MSDDIKPGSLVLLTAPIEFTVLGPDDAILAIECSSQLDQEISIFGSRVGLYIGVLEVRSFLKGTIDVINLDSFVFNGTIIYMSKKLVSVL